MEQPFLPFTPYFLKRLIAMNKVYLVTQTYNRFLSSNASQPKKPLLISDYADYAMAKTHWDALKSDPYRAVLDLNNLAHKTRLLQLLEPGSDYLLFWAVIENLEKLQKHINRKYSEHLRRYIERQTSWRIGSDNSLRPSLQLVFGELFMVLKFSGQTLRLKFTEIESS